MKHSLHTHIRLATGVVYCPDTGLVYVRADDRPTPPKKPRPDDMRLMHVVWSTFRKLLSKHAIRVNGWVLLDSGLQLPIGVADYDGLPAYVSATRAAKGEQLACDGAM